ncbi:MAG: sigma-54 dependent transcriptional regulator [Endomicrobiales bacterium]
MEIRHTILAVDDEPGMRESYKVLLDGSYNLFLAQNASETFEILKKESIDLVLLDIMLPDMDGIEVLRKIKETTDIEVIMVTAVKTVRTAIEAVKLGAYDYISKPFDVDDILATIDKALEKRKLTREIVYLKSELEPHVFENMIGESPEMKQLFALISQVSANTSTVLITGESGTGKELIARAIHQNGPNKNTPFVAVDCATIPENLVESELFGHEKGSFTDATSQKMGKFELAHDGTLFLDEIGNLPLDIQSKLLRVLEEREIQRVGGTRTIKINTRVIAATNLDLKKAVKEGKFRQDLFYRLNVIPIVAPALREHREDITILIDYFIDLFNKTLHRQVKGISNEAREMLVNYNWPGNVRELKNVLERLVVLSQQDIISHQWLPIDILLFQKEKTKEIFDTISLKEARGEFEKQFILKVLEKADWNQVKSAQLLGIHRNALLYKVHMLHLRPIIKRAKLHSRAEGSGRKSEKKSSMTHIDKN